MKPTTLSLIAASATLAVALPTNTPTPLHPRTDSVRASINWFTRTDCQDTCVETGYCLSGQAVTGMSPASQSEWIGWDDGCWDRPAGAGSVALSVDNGHKFFAIDRTCKEFKEGRFEGKMFELRHVQREFGYGECTHMYGDWIKTVFYEW